MTVGVFRLGPMMIIIIMASLTDVIVITVFRAGDKDMLAL